MKEYEIPSTQILELNTDDIIQTSGLTDGGNMGDFTGGEPSGGWGVPTNP